MGWKATLYCRFHCGIHKIIRQRDRGIQLTCPVCGDLMEPVFFEYDIETAMSGGVWYVKREIARLSAYTPLPGLDQFVLGKRYKGGVNDERGDDEQGTVGISRDAGEIIGRTDLSGEDSDGDITEDEERANWAYWCSRE